MLSIKPITQVLFLFTLLFISSFYSEAQVTIGADADPQSGALLDLKEWDVPKDSTNAPNSKKGVLFPKVRLSSSNSLFPLYNTTQEPEMSAAKGMIVYNVNENATGLNVGLCIWNGDEWTSIVGGGPASTAKLEINGNGKIVVTGNLAKDIELTSAINTVTLPITVKQPGSYHVSAYSEPYNQYYFEASGEFLKAGNFNIVLKGTGIPQYATSERNNIKDKIKILINGNEYDVSSVSPSITLPELTVEDISPNYAFNCKQVDISNAKLKVKQSSAGAQITIRLQVSKESIGGKYHIETNAVNGIKFEGSGNLLSEQQAVTLESNGATPDKVGTCNFHFTTNSTNSAMVNCSVGIPVVGKNIKAVVWGADNNGIWDIGANGKGVYNMFQCPELFGLGQEIDNPICPVERIDFSRSNSFPSSLEGIDILIISYPASAKVSSAYAKDLADFVNNSNGVLIQCLEGGDSYELANNIFAPITIDKNSRETNSGTTAASLQAGNQIVNGEYMDLSNKKIGYDGGGNLSFKISDPVNVEIIATRDVDDQPTVIKHKTKPYILLGDGGIFCGSNEFYNASNSPVLVDSKGLPAVISNYNPNKNTSVYNTHLFANMMIWAIKYRLSLDN
ncbi:MAG: hypothetical protein LBG15_06370 [Dysgonamonadaceae bacterium]|jgi:hypothetical protein|nr:hypothetical protein [Dysgonamonadaceae bacterium]